MYHSADPKGRFEESSLPSHHVTLKEFQHTIQVCSLLQKNYRGKILKYQLGGYGVILFGLLLIMLIGMTGDGGKHWGDMVMYILIYLICVPIIHKVSNCFQNKLLRQAHFVLSIVCRSENNRYYLRRGVEVRPGYQARWIEFSVINHELPDKKDLLQLINFRHIRIAE